MRVWPDALMQALGALPLPVLRGLGRVVGAVLYAVVPQRRRVVLTNLRLCFPQWSEPRRRQVARAVFVRFAQAWLDRGWLWHASPELLKRRLRLSDPGDVLGQAQPTVLFAPHFVGLDAGWTRLALENHLRLLTIYTQQSDPGVDAWVKTGRARWGQVRLFRREDGVKRVVKAMRQGEWLYLLPDMNFGAEESIFVPFYGVPAATVPSSIGSALGKDRESSPCSPRRGVVEKRGTSNSSDSASRAASPFWSRFADRSHSRPIRACRLTTTS